MHLDEPYQFQQNVDSLRDTPAFPAAAPTQVKHMANTISSVYSRWRVRVLLREAVSLRSLHYDLVFASRFDFINPLTLDLAALNPARIYASNLHRVHGRLLLACDCVVTGLPLFLKLFNMYPRLRSIASNTTLHAQMEAVNEPPIIAAPETLLTMQAFTLVPFGQALEDLVVYTGAIPNYMTEAQRKARANISHSGSGRPASFAFLSSRIQ